MKQAFKGVRLLPCLLKSASASESHTARFFGFPPLREYVFLVFGKEGGESWAPEDQKLYDLERSLLRRAEDEISSLKELHSRQIRTTEIELDREIVQKMGEYKTIQDQQANAFLAARKERRTGLQGILDGIQSRLNPTLAAEAAQARQKEFIDFHRRLSKERADYENLLQQTKQERMELLHERQAYELSLRQGRLEEERERYIGEYKEAERLRAEYEAQSIHDELERNDDIGDGPPPPKLGK
ncbi:MAG TPA: hypothetical protein VFW40_05960 [Capsulimonadaceae bacterium]|nr:hypothetical protein [Capsulimonadaceae bacterium]